MQQVGEAVLELIQISIASTNQPLNHGTHNSNSAKLKA
jgi:hypothetical protein